MTVHRAMAHVTTLSSTWATQPTLVWWFTTHDETPPGESATHPSSLNLTGALSEWVIFQYVLWYYCTWRLGYLGLTSWHRSSSGPMGLFKNPPKKWGLEKKARDDCTMCQLRLTEGNHVNPGDISLCLCISEGNLGTSRQGIPGDVPSSNPDLS